MQNVVVDVIFYNFLLGPGMEMIQKALDNKIDVFFHDTPTRTVGNGDKIVTVNRQGLEFDPLTIQGVGERNQYSAQFTRDNTTDWNNPGTVFLAGNDHPLVDKSNYHLFDAEL